MIRQETVPEKNIICFDTCLAPAALRNDYNTHLASPDVEHRLFANLLINKITRYSLCCKSISEKQGERF